MSKLRVMTVVGTRPEVIRLSRVIPALDDAFEHRLVHTRQNYDRSLVEDMFDDLDLRMPDRWLNVAGSSPAETIAQSIVQVDEEIEKFSPQAFLVLGDTNSCLSSLAAKRRKVPVFHMEAGNRCWDERVPEEINRRIVDHLADVHLPYSDISRDHLLREGVRPDLIIKTGSPMLEVLTHYLQKIMSSDVLTRLGISRDYYVVECHREENVDVPSRVKDLVETLRNLSLGGMTVVLSAHPRTRRSLPPVPGVMILDPLKFTDYCRLQVGAKAVLSDSGTITEESSILGFPALNMRDAHERPEGMEEAAVPMVGLRWQDVSRGIELLSDGWLARMPHDYNVPYVSKKIPRIILSYADYVRRTVWGELT